MGFLSSISGFAVDIPIAELKGKIDFGIITIRDDEFQAVYDRLGPTDTTKDRRTYDVGSINTSKGDACWFALVRTTAQGEGAAQDTARDLIDDLRPEWLLLVGIAGAVPSADFTLGDVICATRVHDFCVRATKRNEADRFGAAGGPMHKSVEDLLARLPAIERRLEGWNTPDKIGVPLPSFDVPSPESNEYYGDDAWKAEVHRWLDYHFGSSDKPPHQPRVTARQIASSDALLKNPDLVDQWLTEARAIAGIEMELAGVYIAARRPDKEYPILAIRGISDIVGFKRNEAWTQYACNTAGAFAFALIQSGELSFSRPHPSSQVEGRSTTAHQYQKKILVHAVPAKQIQEEVTLFASQQLQILSLMELHDPKATLLATNKLYQDLYSSIIKRIGDTFGDSSTRPLFELLAWTLYQKGIAYTYLFPKNSISIVAADVGNQLELLAKREDLEIAHVLASMVTGFGSYVAEDFVTAVKQAKELLEFSKLGLFLKDAPHWNQPFGLYRRKAVGLANLEEWAEARKAAMELEALVDTTENPIVRYQTLEGLARVEAKLQSPTVWRTIAALSEEQPDDLPSTKQLLIRTRLEAMYYLREPDYGEVEQIKQAASKLGFDNRHMEQINSLANKVLSLRKGTWIARAWRGFTARFR